MPPPNNPFREALERRSVEGADTTANPFRQALQTRAEAPSAEFVAREIAARRVLDNLMAAPDASGELVSKALSAYGAGVETAAAAGMNNVRRLIGAAPKEGPTFAERFERREQRPTLTQRALRNIPRATLEDAAGVVEAIPALVPGGETPSEAYSRGREAFRAEEAAMRAEHPTAATVGDVGGDVLSLLIGRRSTRADKLLQRVETRLAGRSAIGAADDLASDLGRVLTGPAMQRLARGAGRSIETGVEAAALDILKDPNADPIEVAALAAGGQLVGSGALSGAKGLLSGGPTSAGLKLSLAAIGTAGLLQVLKASTPGGRDRVLESVETGYDKVAMALALGAASAAIGATRYGRGNTALADQTRAFLDGLGTVHRGTLLSLLTEWTEGDDKQKATIERVLTEVAQNPAYKGKNDAERAILRRLRDGAELKQPEYKTGGGF